MNTQDAYNAWSGSYDDMPNLTRDLELKATQSTLANKHYGRVLEIGCGTGKNTSWLQGKVERLIAVDFSAGMLEKAREKIAARHVKFVQADLNDSWNFYDQPVGLIICSLVLEHIESLDVIFKEANKALVPQGHFYICELHPFKQYAGSKARFEQSGETHSPTCYVHHISEYMEAAKANGFANPEIREWFDSDDPTGIPRLISFVFQKDREEVPFLK